MKLPKPGTERAEGPRCNFENRTRGKMRGVAVWWSGFERDCTVVVLCCKFEGEAVLKANPFTPDSGHSQRQLRAQSGSETHQAFWMRDANSSERAKPEPRDLTYAAARRSACHRR